MYGGCSDDFCFLTCQCCAQGYYSSPADILCVCPAGPGSPFWYPYQAECKEQDDCVESKYSYGRPRRPQQELLRLNILNCYDKMYYGVQFIKGKKIPYFAMYKFDADNADERAFVMRPLTPDFTVHPCTEENLNANQCDDACYANLNRGNAAAGLVDPEGWHKGHLVPFADFKVFS